MLRVNSLVGFGRGHVDVGLSASVVEALSALDAPSGSVVLGTPTVAEAASAADSPSAQADFAASATEAASATDTSSYPTPSYTTWNPSDKSSNMSLSGGDLIVTTTSGSDGGVRGVAGKTSGLLYAEFPIGANMTGGNCGVGIALARATLTTIGSAAANACILFKSGNIYFNGSYTGITVGPWTAGTSIIVMAVDLGAKKIAFKRDAAITLSDVSSGIDISAIFPGAGAYPVMCANANAAVCTLDPDNTTAYIEPTGYAGWPA